MTEITDEMLDVIEAVKGKRNPAHGIRDVNNI